MANERKGLSNKGSAIFFETVSQIRPSVPNAIRPAPTREPVKACVVETGSPALDATSTQRMVPLRIAGASDDGMARSGWMRPLLNVLTIALVTNAAVAAPITVHNVPGERTTGRYDGLATDGALRLRLDDGRIEHIHAGDVTLANPPPAR